MSSPRIDVHEIARLIDHSLLVPDAQVSELGRCCEEAIGFGVASVCILPYFVSEARQLLQGSSVRTSTTVAFPHGAQSTLQKVAETHAALEAGAEELDVVVNISWVKSGRFAEVRTELEQLTGECHRASALLKVILETALLTDDEKKQLCHLCSEVGVDFVKTSTGFASSGATPADVALLRRETAAGIGVKASGGIRDLGAVLEYKQLGATRIGTSRTAEILAAARRQALEA